MSTEQHGSDSPLPRPMAGGDWIERLADWRDRLAEWRPGTGEGRPSGRLGRLGVVLACLAIGAAVTWWVLPGPQPPPPIETLLPTVTVADVTSDSSPDSQATIMVHVAGAVTRPGLVEVPAGSRVADAVAAAGGATTAADLDRINLAIVLGDEDHVAVPEVGEQLEMPLAPEPAADPEDPQVLDLNRASAEELEGLPGVGPATAAAIVAHREEHGAFVSVAALDEVPGIGPAKLAQLRDLVRVRR